MYIKKKHHETNISFKYVPNSIKLNIIILTPPRLIFPEINNRSSTIPNSNHTCLNCKRKFFLILKTCKSDHFEFR